MGEEEEAAAAEKEEEEEEDILGLISEGEGRSLSLLMVDDKRPGRGVDKQSRELGCPQG